MDDLALHQRNDQHQDQRQTEQKDEQHREARQTAAQPPEFQPVHSRAKQIGNGKGRGKRHQNPLQQGHDDNRGGDNADPEQRPIEARGHKACSERARMRAHRTI